MSNNDKIGILILLVLPIDKVIASILTCNLTKPGNARDLAYGM